jgi:hypothetical protein
VEVELRHLRTFVAMAASLSPVSLAFRPGVREPLLRSFVQAARAAGDLQYE